MSERGLFRLPILSACANNLSLSVETFLVSFLLNGLWETMKEREFMFSCRQD